MVSHDLLSYFNVHSTQQQKDIIKDTISELKLQVEHRFHVYDNRGGVIDHHIEEAIFGAVMYVLGDISDKSLNKYSDNDIPVKDFGEIYGALTAQKIKKAFYRV